MTGDEELEKIIKEDATLAHMTPGVVFEAEEQAKRTEYEAIEHFNDFCEMVIQYGFVTLFVVAFPLTPLCAYFNNVVEMHIDAYKLTFEHRRPAPKPAENIGAWADFMEVMSTVCVVTNCGVIFFTSHVFPLSEYGYATKLVLFLIFENALLVLRKVVKDLTPRSPPHLEALLARGDCVLDRVFKETKVSTQKAMARRSQLQCLVRP